MSVAVVPAESLVERSRWSVIFPSEDVTGLVCSLVVKRASEVMYLIGIFDCVSCVVTDGCTEVLPVTR